MVRVWTAFGLVLGLAAGTAAGAAAQDEPSVITKPEWARKPDASSLLRWYPDAARRQGLAGRATVECTVTAEGLLTGCAVLSESPPGYGFGEATVQAAKDFRMKPQTVDGTPVTGAVVRIPLRWTFSGEMIKRPYLRTLQWASAPSRADVAAANKNGGVGEAWLDCDFTGEGGLRDCTVANETPDRAGLGRAALALADRFQAAHPPAAGVRGLVPFKFGPGGEPEARAKLDLAQGPGGAAFLAAYPQAARAAGVVEGRAVLSCTVVAGGAVERCSVAEESPAGLGFGASALSLSDKFRVNPWTSDGEPVDGRTIRLPIRYEDMAEPAAPAAPAP